MEDFKIRISRYNNKKGKLIIRRKLKMKIIKKTMKKKYMMKIKKISRLKNNNINSKNKIGSLMKRRTIKTKIITNKRKKRNYMKKELKQSQ